MPIPSQTCLRSTCHGLTPCLGTERPLPAFPVGTSTARGSSGLGEPHQPQPGGTTGWGCLMDALRGSWGATHIPPQLQGCRASSHSSGLDPPAWPSEGWEKSQAGTSTQERGDLRARASWERGDTSARPISDTLSSSPASSSLSPSSCRETLLRCSSLGPSPSPQRWQEHDSSPGEELSWPSPPAGTWGQATHTAAMD